MSENVEKPSWIRHIVAKILDDSVSGLVRWLLILLATAVLLGLGFALDDPLSLFRALTRNIDHWLSERVTITRLWALLIVTGVILANCLALWTLRIQRAVGTAEQPLTSSEPSMRGQVKPTKFNRFAIVDTKFDLEWHILRDPADWIGDTKLLEHSSAYQASILAGPYHIGNGCKSELATEWNGGEMRLQSHCAVCGAETISDTLGLDEMRTGTLRELQRMNRSGVAIREGTALQSPLYWNPRRRF